MHVHQKTVSIPMWWWLFGPFSTLVNKEGLIVRRSIALFWYSIRS